MECNTKSNNKSILMIVLLYTLPSIILYNFKDWKHFLDVDFLPANVNLLNNSSSNIFTIIFLTADATVFPPMLESSRIYKNNK